MNCLENQWFLVLKKYNVINNVVLHLIKREAHRALHYTVAELRN
jgi:hypothetical protein